ncbi:MAG: radical SAM protein [Nanoarchaeota archaeon]
MADVILLYPKIKEKTSFYRNPIERIKELHSSIPIPLGLLSISRYLVDRFKVKIIDQRTDKDWKKHLLKELNQNPLCIATTSTTGLQINYALEISKFVKQNSNIPVVWGGVHPSLLPRQTLENPNIDILVKGEGEITFFELVKAMEKNRTLKGINGVSFKKNGIIQKNPDRSPPDLSSLPDIPYHLIDMGEYTTRLKKSILIENSRGCSKSCTFCITPTIPFRFIGAEKLIKQIKHLNQCYKIKNFFFTDENFFLNNKEVEKITNTIIRDKIDINWFAGGGDINSLQKCNLKILRKSGCTRVLLGAESGSQRVLDFINKGCRVNEIQDVSKKFRNSNIRLSISFMMGLPNETLEDSIKTINLMFNLLNKNNDIALSIYKPYPDTPLFLYALKKGFKVPQSLVEWGHFNQNHLNMPWIHNDIKKMEKYWFILNDIQAFPKIINKYIQTNLHKKMLNLLMGKNG